MSKILMILSGGVACYKSAHLIRLLQSRGHTIYPVMTESAQQFITPMTISALACNPVRSCLFDEDDGRCMDHIHLSRQCDMVLVVPATANFIAKMAQGTCDDLASTIVVASDKPIVVVPAMNPYMWNNPATQHNLDVLKSRFVHIISPKSGEMACGEVGVGRLPEPEYIGAWVDTFLQGRLAGKRFLITLGATSEPIDTVRVLTNKSSGLQGVLVAQSILNQGGDVVIVRGETTVSMPVGAVVYDGKTAQDMYTHVHALLDSDGADKHCAGKAFAGKAFAGKAFDCAIMVAAVSDYRIKNPLNKKHKKSDGALSLELMENPDILHSVCHGKNRPKCVIGFAAETDNVVAYAQAKLTQKGCDMIFANAVDSDVFGGTQSHGYIITADTVHDLGMQKKYEHADAVVQWVYDIL